MQLRWTLPWCMERKAHWVVMVISLSSSYPHTESTPSFLCTHPTIPLRVCACACYKQKIHSDSRWGDGCHAAPCFPWLSKNRKEEESDGEAERWQRIGSEKGKMLRETLGLNWSVRVEKKTVNEFVSELGKWRNDGLWHEVHSIWQQWEHVFRWNLQKWLLRITNELTT